ncbi:hypothetical protein L2E82_40575 [Cichorium intybus]|uniref:Uncharacterized protein n=1 Tax=Cichorium intybus TaxID=13427 RepID=A0ACB9ALD8_CICIN|nr:hypothetical protein L2E82_40575 [Cichorium intybus]
MCEKQRTTGWRGRLDDNDGSASPSFPEQTTPVSPPFPHFICIGGKSTTATKGKAIERQRLLLEHLRPSSTSSSFENLDSSISILGFWTVYGVEYAFGGSDNSKPGIVKLEPKHFQGLQIRKSILIGRTELSEDECREFIKKMAKDYPGNSYNIIFRNCNHFANDASKRLTKKLLAGWINRLARVIETVIGGHDTRCTVDDLRGTILSEDSRKYGAENTCTSGSALSKAAMSYSSACMDIEREREKSFEIPWHIGIRSLYVIEVARRQAKVKESSGNPDNLSKFEAAQGRLHELKSNMTVEAEKHHHQNVLNILDRLEGEMLQERQRIEASPMAAVTSPISSSPSYDEINGVFVFERKDNAADNTDYFLGEAIHPYQAESDAELSLIVGDYVVVRKVSAMVGGRCCLRLHVGATIMCSLSHITGGISKIITSEMYVDQSVTIKACVGLNGMNLGGQLLTADDSQELLSTESFGTSSPGAERVRGEAGPKQTYPSLKQAQAHARRPAGSVQIQSPSLLKLNNVVDPQSLMLLSEQELEEILEDIRLEYSRFHFMTPFNDEKGEGIFV